MGPCGKKVRGRVGENVEKISEERVGGAEKEKKGSRRWLFRPVAHIGGCVY